ncbi:transcription factor bHLH143-like [Magnolia sinica]|uniref:transcription factor bHLH143-like n=1 Tax=Magnolia sinica TaxID=86752 RepID=UPI00265A4531|nr:transcription factor bHLH143-like [Magnolia sinica]XP_058096991.1 transcription factor bHLH143-like [Magnolia sinica]XP_058096992.1 transcription factor bHLH143-like [Magnolia sinica]
MGKDCSSWLCWHHLPWQSPNLNGMSIPSDPGQQSSVHPTLFSSHKNPFIFLAPPSRTVPGFAVSEFHERKAAGGNEPQLWYHGYPNHAFSPATTKSILGERFSAHELCELPPNTGEKKKEVFDQSLNRMSFVFSSIGYPLQDAYHADPKLLDANGFHAELPTSREPFIHEFVKMANWCELGENNGTGIPCGDGSGMHEDTEELDALLCSDDDDEEETSTGHSPFEMAGYERKGKTNGNAEVASSVTPTKRRRLDEENDPSLMDTASSGKAWVGKDDAESSCVKGTVPSSANKRLRKMRIHETVAILRSIIPGGKGKDAATILDEAIQYLKSLGLKAKAIGVATVK